MIRFIKSAAPVGYGYAVGEKAELSIAIEAELVETKFAEYVDGEGKTEKAAIEKGKTEKAISKK